MPKSFNPYKASKEDLLKEVMRTDKMVTARRDLAIKTYGKANLPRAFAKLERVYKPIDDKMTRNEILRQYIGRTDFLSMNANSVTAIENAVKAASQKYGGIDSRKLFSIYEQVEERSGWHEWDSERILNEIAEEIQNNPMATEEDLIKRGLKAQDVAYEEHLDNGERTYLPESWSELEVSEYKERYKQKRIAKDYNIKGNIDSKNMQSTMGYVAHNVLYGDTITINGYTYRVGKHGKLTLEE